MKSQLREANKLEAKYALMIGENEINDGNVIFKDLSKGIQKTILQSDIINFFEELTN
jgi:histidyl-tRNA synthetase